VGLWKNSITLFQHAIRHTENNLVAHLKLGQAYAGTGQDKNALKHFKKAVQINPSAAKIWYSLGGFWMGKKNYQRAVRCYNRAMQYTQSCADICTDKAVAHMALGEIDTAVSLYKKALQEDPEYYPAQHYLGLALIMRGDLNRAIDHLKRAAEIGPQIKEIKHSLVLARKMRKRLNSAAIEFQEAMNNIDKADPKLREKAANLLNKKLLLYKHIQSYEKSISIQPGFQPGYLNLNKLIGMSALNQQYMNLMPIWKDGLQKHPNSSVMAYHLACGYALQKESEKAAEWLEKALDAGFDNQSALQQDLQLQDLPCTSNFKSRISR
jgi:tetratricopeptide (TPR) repeat protein